MKIIKKMSKTKIILIVIPIIIVFIGYKKFFNKNDDVLDFKKIDFDTVDTGDIYQTVEATGEINPVNLVTVGAQVSGQIKEIYVDYNSVVKKGDILAKIDPDILEKNLTEAKATLAQEKSNLSLKQLNLERAKTLYENNFVAKVELDNAQNALNLAEEDYKKAKINYDKAKVNLAYTIITSPLSGTIVTRDVDKGQTVTSGYTTPTLFTIAEDLTKMQILASVSEADIGLIKAGQDIKFSVDTYRNKSFNGKIKEVRLGATIKENVVIYTVVIDIDNSENLFLPGMTAYVNIITDSVKNVKRIRNTTLRFKASDTVSKIFGINNIDNMIEKVSKNKSYAVVYKLDKNNKIKPILIKKGLSNITRTEIISDEIQKGDRIISDYLITEHKNNFRR